MNNLKRIGIGVGLSTIAAFMITEPVFAKSNNGTSTSYTTFVDDDYFYSGKGHADALIDCSLSNFDNYIDADYDFGDNVFSNASKKYDIEYAYKTGYKVIDLGLMADIMNEGLDLDEYNKVFDNGVMIIRSYEDLDFRRYICKCSESDFDEFFNSFDMEFEDHGDDIYIARFKNSNDDSYDHYVINYDRENEILDYTVSLN